MKPPISSINLELLRGRDHVYFSTFYLLDNILLGTYYMPGAQNREDSDTVSALRTWQVEGKDTELGSTHTEVTAEVAWGCGPPGKGAQSQPGEQVGKQQRHPGGGAA